MARQQYLFSLVLTLGAFLGPPLAERTPMVEICDNGLDDDNDGLIDLNDTDCDCPVYQTPSLIPNPSFEDQTCCPADRGNLNCSVGWIQASEATTDLIDTCGWFGFDNLPPPPPPFPDGHAIMGFRNGIPLRMDTGEAQPNWKEYAGACLNRKMLAGETYRFEFYIGYTPENSPYTNVVFYGTTDCENLPFGIGDTNFGCPTNDPNWRQLGLTNIGNFNGRTTWQLKEITVTPNVDIAAIAIGPDCAADNTGIEPYYFFDNLILAEESAFEFTINTRGNNCSPEFTLSAPLRDTLTYQWYIDGIALVGETDREIVTNERHGIYEVRLTGPNSCVVLDPFDFTRPTLRSEKEVEICHEDTYNFHGKELTETGTYLDTLKSQLGCDSVVTLQLLRRSPIFDTLAVTILPGESYQSGGKRFSRIGENDLQLSTDFGCDSLLHLSIDHYRVYIPNAFSPNFDGINDKFGVNTGEGVLGVQEMEVYDRWGDLLFSGATGGRGEELQPEMHWTGETKRGPAPSGTYLYRIRLLFDDGKSRQFSGDLVLLR